MEMTLNAFTHGESETCKARKMGTLDTLPRLHRTAAVGSFQNTVGSLLLLSEMDKSGPTTLYLNK